MAKQLKMLKQKQKITLQREGIDSCYHTQAKHPSECLYFGPCDGIEASRSNGLGDKKALIKTFHSKAQTMLTMLPQ